MKLSDSERQIMELLVPQKGDFICDNLDGIDKIKAITQAVLNTAGEKQGSTDIVSARIKLADILETTDVNLSSVERYMYFDKHFHLRRFITIGVTACDNFSEETYREIFRSFENSFYFVFDFAVRISLSIEEELDSCKRENKLIYFQSSVDWIVALYNSLCYHNKVFVLNSGRLNQKEDNSIEFIVCVCSIIYYLIEELQKSYEYVRSASGAETPT